MQGMVSVYRTNSKGWYFDFCVYHTAKLTQTKLWRPISQAVQTFSKFCSNQLKAMVFYFKKNLTVLISKKWKLVKILFLSWHIHFVSTASLASVYRIPSTSSTASLDYYFFKIKSLFKSLPSLAYQARTLRRIPLVTNLQLNIKVRMQSKVLWLIENFFKKWGDNFQFPPICKLIHFSQSDIYFREAFCRYMLQPQARQVQDPFEPHRGGVAAPREWRE